MSCGAPGQLAAWGRAHPKTSSARRCHQGKTDRSPLMDGERDGEDLPTEDSKVQPSLGALARSKSSCDSLTLICGHTQTAAGRACRDAWWNLAPRGQDSVDRKEERHQAGGPVSHQGECRTGLSFLRSGN